MISAGEARIMKDSLHNMKVYNPVGIAFYDRYCECVDFGKARHH
jgi:hypothetical protein